MNWQQQLVEEAQQRDRRPDRAAQRDQFYFPGPADKPHVYLCGNSLGLQPRTLPAKIEQVLGDWRSHAVDAHFNVTQPWMAYHENLQKPLANLLGAQPREVVCMNSLSVNLHLMMASFYRPTRERPCILIEGNAFPSDRYAVASQLRFHGYDPADCLLQLSPRPGEATLRSTDILETIAQHGSRIALILLGAVNYYSGQLYDMKEITRAGHNQGCLVGFDLAHAAGNVELQLHDWDVDWAAFCGYKYLNSGPGGLSGIFVNDRFARDHSLPRFSGWWGHDKSSRFAMPEEFRAIPGAEGWQLSNPAILPMAALWASLELFNAVGMLAIRQRSMALTAFLEHSLKQHCSGAYKQLTPSEPESRGAQLSLYFPKGAEHLMQRLSAQGIVGDLRKPDVIRIAPAPLYNNYEDCARFVIALEAAVKNQDLV